MNRIFAFVLAGVTGIAGVSVGAAETATYDADALRRELVQQVKACPRGTLNFVIGYNPGGNTYTLGNGFIAYLRRVAVGELLFKLGGSRSELIGRMKIETAEANRIFVAKD